MLYRATYTSDKLPHLTEQSGEAAPDPNHRNAHSVFYNVWWFFPDQPKPRRQWPVDVDDITLDDEMEAE